MCGQAAGCPIHKAMLENVTEGQGFSISALLALCSDDLLCVVGYLAAFLAFTP